MSKVPANHNGNDDLLSQWSNTDYWRKICPYLTISESKSFGGEGKSEAVSAVAGDAQDKLLNRLIDDGYSLINSSICNNNLRETLGRGISELELHHELPATFILLFDETWNMAAESHRLLLRKNDQKEESEKGILRAKNMAFNFDMLAWHVDPRLDQSGFSPHRDRQPDTLNALEKSFYTDGQAKYITHWIALADANPENSCLYVIPKEFDPGYLKGDDPPDEDEVDGNTKNDESKKESNENGNEQFSDPLSRALNTKQSYQNIRALPRQAGQSVIFTHRILHWGSKGNKHALNIQPRIALSFVYSDAEFETPYLTEQSFAEDGSGKWNAPPFSIRLLLVCAQLLIYYQRFNLSTPTLRACYDYCKSNADKLHDAYRKKVFVEYVKAMKERRDGVEDGDDNKCSANITETNEVDDGANSEDEEALLEEMLNHSEEFDDDYDDICDDDDDDDQRGNTKKRKFTR